MGRTNGLKQSVVFEIIVGFRENKNSFKLSLSPDNCIPADHVSSSVVLGLSTIRSGTLFGIWSLTDWFPHDDVTSLNGNIFRVTGHLCGEFTGPRWIPHTKASDTELWFFSFDLRLNKRLSKQSWGCWLETLSRPLWRHRNDSCQPRQALKIIYASCGQVCAIRVRGGSPAHVNTCSVGITGMPVCNCKCKQHMFWKHSFVITFCIFLWWRIIVVGSKGTRTYTFAESENHPCSNFTTVL